MDEIQKTQEDNPTPPGFFEDPGPAIQEAAEKHLEAVWDNFYREEDGEFADDLEHESLASAPFCGCSRCEVREVLAGAWPLIERYFEGSRAAPTTTDGMPPRPSP